MTIISRQRADRYAIIPNAVAEDGRLSFEARGVLCYLLAKPHNWQVQIADIQRAGDIGRDKVYRILNELIAAGYVKRVVRRDDQARIVSHDYVVYDDAVPDQLPFPEKTFVDDLLPEKPKVAKPLPEKPDTENPDTAFQDGITRTDSLTKTHLQRAGARGGKDFNILWDSWSGDRPDSRETAAKAFAKLSRDEQAIAIATAPTHCAIMRLRKKPARMIPFLGKKLFVELDGAPDYDFDGHFVITPDRPEWREWLGSIRRQYGETGVQSTVRHRKLLRETRWPPDLSLANDVTNLAPSGMQNGASSAARGNA